MKRGFIAAAAILTALGIALFGGALIAAGFDFSKLATMEFSKNTCYPDGDFRNIEIKLDVSDIKIMPATDGRVSAECFESDELKFSLAVKNDTLTVCEVDNRAWYDRASFFNRSPYITLYLPAGQYGSLYIKGDTGNTVIYDGFTFETVEITGATGNVDCGASALGKTKISLSTGDIDLHNCSAGEVELSVSTGDVDLDRLDCGGDISVTITTGRLRVDSVACAGFYTSGSTGDITLKDLFASRSFDIKRSTGSVRFDNCDASRITVKTSTGSVTGIIATEKLFIARSSTGSVNVPRTTSGGICEIATSTGKIDISLAE